MKMDKSYEKENNTVRFSLYLPAEEVKKAENAVYKKNKQYFNIPGFRKGKAPKKLIENMYGKDFFVEDAINEVLPKAYEEKIEELDLDVIDQPKVTIDEYNAGQDVEVKIEVEVSPDVEIGDYKKLEIEKVSEEVTEDQINTRLEQERQKNARRVNIDDRKAEDGDIVSIDYVGRVDGEEFEGGSAQDQELELGSGTFIPGFEEQIVGKEIGETFDVNVTFPEKYQAKELEGKDAVFEVTLKAISKEELPEINDDFIMDISEFDTVDEYKNHIKEHLAESNKSYARQKREEELMEELVKITKVDLPQVMVERVIDDRVASYSQNFQQQGISMDQYLAMLNTNMEDFRDSLKEDAEKVVITRLAMDEIVRQEGFEVTEEEIKQEAQEIADKYFGEDEKQKEEMVKFMLNSNDDRMKQDLTYRKAVDFLLEHAKEVEKKEDDKEEADDQE